MYDVYKKMDRDNFQNIFLYIITVTMIIIFCLLAVSCKGEPKEQKSSAGEKIWQSNCKVCHLQGLGGAPVYGKAAEWKPRIAKGIESLYANAINGFSSSPEKQMPPKGGNASLTDEEVKMAVDYMIQPITKK